MAVPLHTAPDDRPVSHIERGEERGRPVACVVVGHGAAATPFQRQTRLRPVECLNL